MREEGIRGSNERREGESEGEQNGTPDSNNRPRTNRKTKRKNTGTDTNRFKHVSTCGISRYNTAECVYIYVSHYHHSSFVERDKERREEGEACELRMKEGMSSQATGKS